MMTQLIAAYLEIQKVDFYNIALLQPENKVLKKCIYE